MGPSTPQLQGGISPQYPAQKDPNDFTNTHDYHMFMSAFVHQAVDKGLWKNMSGKQIVNEFNKQRAIINNHLAQQARIGQHRVAMPTPTSPLSPPGTYQF